MTMSLSAAQRADVSAMLHSMDITATNLFATLLTTEPMYGNLAVDGLALLAAMNDDAGSRPESVQNWMRDWFQKTCCEEIRTLARADAGLHFDAKHATQEQLEDFDLSHLVETYRTTAPTVWALFQGLLDADAERLETRRRWRRKRKAKKKRERGAAAAGVQRDAGEEAPPAGGSPRGQDHQEGRLASGHQTGAGTGGEHRAAGQEAGADSDIPPLLWEDLDGPEDDPEDAVYWRAVLGLPVRLSDEQEVEADEEDGDDVRDGGTAGGNDSDEDAVEGQGEEDLYDEEDESEGAASMEKVRDTVSMNICEAFM